MKHRKESSLNPVQMTFEAFVAVGYFMGFSPFLYYIAMFWVIPFTIVNIIFSVFAGNRTLPFTIVNFFMALLGLIPIIGYIPRVIGFSMSIISMMTIMKKL